VGEEDFLGGGMVIGPVVRGRGPRVRAVGGEFEEEDYAVDRVEGGEVGGVEGEEFFELDVFYAEVFEEVCEDALERRALLAVGFFFFLLCSFLLFFFFFFLVAAIVRFLARNVIRSGLRRILIESH